jgi:hypothetical protein
VGSEIDRRDIPMAILAKETDDGLAFAGAAVFALTGGDREKMITQFERLAVNRAPLALSRRSQTRWIKPKNVGEGEALAGGSLRHASVKALAT